MNGGLLLVLALPLIVVAFVIVTHLAFASFRSPVSVVLTVFAVIVPVGSLIVLPVPLPPPFNTASSLVGALAVGALAVHVIGARAAGERPGHLWIPSGVWWWLLFGGLASLSFLWSMNPDATVEELVVFLSLLALYALAAFARTTPHDLDRFETAIVLGGAIAAGYAIVLLLTGGLSEFGGETQRFASAGGAGGEAGPNETAAALLLPLAVAGSRAIDAHEDRRTLWIGVAGLIAMAIALTASRGGLLAMFVLVGILAINAGRWRIIVFMTFFTAAALLIVPRFGAEALQERLFKETSSGRTMIWSTALRACDRHCVTGSGYGSFPDAYNEALGVSPLITGDRLRQRAHNIWIRAVIELGVLGLVLLSGALYLHVRDLLRLPRFRRGAALAGLSGVLVANVFLSNLGFKYFWLAMIHAMLTILVWTREREAVPPTIEAAAALTARRTQREGASA
jgi:O-antigen ligase